MCMCMCVCVVVGGGRSQPCRFGYTHPQDMSADTSTCVLPLLPHRTSMACPHAAGVAALVWGQRPTCSHTTIRCALQRSALDIAPTGRDTGTGFGLVRARAAVTRLTTSAGAATCSCV
jgi:hypothetical protein